LARRAALSASVPPSARGFALGVTATALPFVAAMQWLDAASSGIACDDVADLFGGSLALGAGMTIAFGCAVAIACHAFVGFLCRRHRSIVLAIEAFVRLTRSAEPCAQHIALDHQDRSRAATSLVRRTRGERAPPLRRLRTLHH